MNEKKKTWSFYDASIVGKILLLKAAESDFLKTYYDLISKKKLCIQKCACTHKKSIKLQEYKG